MLIQSYNHNVGYIFQIFYLYTLVLSYISVFVFFFRIAIAINASGHVSLLNDDAQIDSSYMIDHALSHCIHTPKRIPLVNPISSGSQSGTMMIASFVKYQQSSCTEKLRKNEFSKQLSDWLSDSDWQLAVLMGPN